MVIKISRYTRRLNLLVSEQQYHFVKFELNGGISHHLRGMIGAYMGNVDKDLETLKKQFTEVEPIYLSLKKRIEQAEAEKKILEDERRTKETRIEEAHEKLLIELKDHHNRIEDVPKSVFKIYSEYCGVGIEILKAWLAEQAKRIEGE